MKHMLEMFKALSDGNRLRIVAALTAHDELCACHITELLQVTGATASRHLGLLIRAGLIDSRKDGRWVHYRLVKDSPHFAAVMAWLEAEFTSSEPAIHDLERLKKITICSK